MGGLARSHERMFAYPAASRKPSAGDGADALAVEVRCVRAGARDVAVGLEVFVAVEAERAAEHYERDDGAGARAGESGGEREQADHGGDAGDAEVVGGLWTVATLHGNQAPMR